jgi:hypothetical protein
MLLTFISAPNEEFFVGFQEACRLLKAILVFLHPA